MGGGGAKPLWGAFVSLKRGLVEVATNQKTNQLSQ